MWLTRRVGGRSPSCRPSPIACGMHSGIRPIGSDENSIAQFLWALPNYPLKGVPDYGGSGAARRHAKSGRFRHRRGDGGEYLPLRNLRAHSRRHQAGGFATSVVGARHDRCREECRRCFAPHTVDQRTGGRIFDGVPSSGARVAGPRPRGLLEFLPKSARPTLRDQ
jgi:hypothetical protein